MNMKKKWIWMAPLAILGIVAFLFVGGEVVMRLWNWLLPPLFGWRQLGFWQALGLLALCRILFGGLGGHGGHRSQRGRRFGGCRSISPEERERLRKAMAEGYNVGSAGSERTAQ
jgi:hypothetical protein